jgi:DNA topoisomerase I
VALLQAAQVWVGKAGRTVKARNPLTPFTTSSLQQAASKGLGLSPEKTMALAQTLYEQGWITYMRTDGVSIAPEAQTAAQDYIAREHGADYLPPEPPIYLVKTANAQEAHEAIRPTDVNHLPKDAPADGDGAALYALIWKRFVASQMSPALYTVNGAVIYVGKAQGQPFPMEFRAQGRSLLFDGFLKVYEEPADDGETGDEEAGTLPPLKDNQLLKLVAPQVEEHLTRSPARYTEAALVQALEQRGIGRPSTYANMVKTVKDKGYVKVSQKRLIPTENGIALCDFLTAHFAEVLAVDYTARLENQLDRIASGNTTRLEVLRAFWDEFNPQLGKATEYALAQMKVRHAPKPLMLRPAED